MIGDLERVKNTGRYRLSAKFYQRNNSSKYGTWCYALELSNRCEASNPDGFYGLPEKQELPIDAVDRDERGQFDADRGGGVIKHRIARPGQLRSKGLSNNRIIAPRGEAAIWVSLKLLSLVEKSGLAAVARVKGAAQVLLMQSTRVPSTVARATGEIVRMLIKIKA